MASGRRPTGKRPEVVGRAWDYPTQQDLQDWIDLIWASDADGTPATPGTGTEILFNDSNGVMDADLNLTWDGTELDLTGDLVQVGDIDLTGALDVTGAATISSTLGVTGDISAGADIDLTGDIEPASDATSLLGLIGKRFKQLFLGGADVVALTIKAVASVTANLLELQNSAGTTLLYVRPDGRIRFENATTWDDLRVAAFEGKVLGFSDPDVVQFMDDGAASTGVYTYAFDKSTEEELFFSVQLPHIWKQGSSIEPHIHWSPSGTDTGNVVWGLEYTWANIDATFGNTAIITATGAGTGTAKDHVYTDFSAISATGKTLSSMLVCRVFRKAADAADTYDEDAFLLELDFHYEIDSTGSEVETTKT